MSGHNHSNLTGGALRQAFLLTAIILIVEAGAGYLSHSLALLSDAGHILTDVVADMAASVGVIVAGLLIIFTGWLYADPLISVAISALIAWSAIRIVLDTLNVLMEGVPAGIDLEQVAQAVRSTDGVDSVHDLHVWSISGQQVALSCHVVVAEELLAAESEHLVRRVEEAVCDRFGIGHTTIQVEACHPCTGEALEHGLGDRNHPHAVDQVGSTR